MPADERSQNGATSRTDSSSGGALAPGQAMVEQEPGLIAKADREHGRLRSLATARCYLRNRSGERRR
jgi:hypothetical protein